MSEPTARLERILEDAGIGLWLMHLPSGKVTSNAVFRRMIGEDLRAPGSSPGARYDAVWLENLHPDDKPEVLRWRDRLLSGELDGYLIDYRTRREGGGWTTLRSRVRVAECDADGRALWISGVLIDVSAEKELDRRLHALFDRPFQYIGLLTPDGVTLETSRSSLEASGVAADVIVGKRLWETPLFAHSDTMQANLRDGVARAAAGEMVRFEIHHPGSGGKHRTVDFTLTPLRDDDGVVVNIIPEGRDITELANTREALRAAEARLSSTTSNANLGLWDWDPDTDEAWFNDEWYTMLGYTPGELPASGTTWAKLLHPDDRENVQRALADHLEGRSDEYRVEFRLRCKDGSWRWMLTHARRTDPAPGSRTRRLSGIHMDITERKEMALQLASAQRLESIGHLAAGVAHEINTPVQYVSDSLYFIREGVQELLANAEQREDQHSYLKDNLPAALDRALDGLARVSEIVRTMKDFSHPDLKQMSFIDLNRTLQNTLVVARNEYNQVAELVTDFGELPQIWCHGGEINQVLLNLVVNAAHAIADVDAGADAAAGAGSAASAGAGANAGAGASGAAPLGRITVTTRLAGDEVLITVTDTGGGIPEAIRERVFDQFFTTKEVGRGTGQGLAIAHNVVVRRHGGRLSFHSETGRGTSFFVHLPVQPAANLQGEVAA